jgi:tRNA isopentenyl-2-thiomethyl-A-37 hydroxylase MiaE
MAEYQSTTFRCETRGVTVELDLVYSLDLGTAEIHLPVMDKLTPSLVREWRKVFEEIQQIMKARGVTRFVIGAHDKATAQIAKLFGFGDPKPCPHTFYPNMIIYRKEAAPWAPQ